MLGVIASSRRKIREDYYQLFKDRVLADGGTFIENPIVFNSEKLLLTPNAYKTGKIYSALPHDGSGDFTFSRNSSATYIEDGIIKTALPNVPRIQDGKILIEEQSTNYILSSENLNELWGKTDCGVYLGTSLSPNGINAAYYLKNNPTGFSRLNSNTISLIQGENIYISIFLKKVDWDLISIVKFNGIEVLGTFDFTNKTVSYESNNTSNIIFEDFANGWVRVKLVYKPQLTENSIFYFRITSGGNNVEPDKSMYIWGIDMKNNDSSYIPTNGTIVTRLADIATVTPPTGVTEIIETIDGVDNTITVIPPTYQLPVGEINKVIMK